jgi:hypothetical protein
MPLKVNIGASKKVADQNYGSRVASVNLEIELDASLVNEPTKLQEKIRQMFGLVRQSLTEELNGANGNGHTPPANNNGNGNGNGHSPPANGNGNGSSRNGNPRQATQSQVKAIHAIARNRRIDVGQFLNDRFHVNKPEDLNIKEASQVIDELKSDSKEERRA